MRNRVLSKVPHVRISLALLLTLVSLALSGCGGGGGSSSTPNPNPNPNPGGGTGGTGSGFAVSGKVVDTVSGGPVVGATITIAGSTAARSVATGSDGTFTVTDVSPTATTFSIARPASVGGYSDYVIYQAKRYDPTACTLPLPTLTANSTTPLPGNIQLYGAANSEAPPPPPLIGPTGGVCGI